MISGLFDLVFWYLARLVAKLPKGSDATYKYHRTDFQKRRPQLEPQHPHPKLYIDKETGVYSISFGTNRTLGEGIVKIYFQKQWYSSQPNKHERHLKLHNMEESQDDNKLGHYKLTRLIWQFEDKFIHTLFKEYQDRPFLIFEQYYPEEINGTAIDTFETPIILFPSFKNFSPNKNIFTFRNRIFAPPDSELTHTSGPVLFYDDNLNTFLISSMNNFFIGIIRKNGDRIDCGIEGEIDSIQANFTFRFICYFGKGVNSTFIKWGDILLKFHDAERKSAYADEILSYLGFWTDNGAYYYYRTEPGLSYEETFEKIESYAQTIGLPLQYYQLDSWWYKKAYRRLPTRVLKLFVGGNLGWSPLKGNFPSGLAEFSKRLAKPFIAHNRWFSKNNEDLKDFPHVIEGLWGHPTTYEFWELIMQRCNEYGIICYEQDWIKNQLDHFRYLRENTHTAQEWLYNMAKAAENHNLTIQYCMATPAIFLHSVEFKAVTHIRCGQDYNARFPKTFFIPDVTQTSIFAHAVGLWPFFDCFMSSSQPMKLFYREKYPELCALVSNLSGGLVGPADRYYLLNKTLLMKTCRSDGLLLKPDRPATPIDLMFQQHAKYYIISTESQKDDLRWYYIALINFYPKHVKDQTLTLVELGITYDCVLFDFQTKKCQIVDPNVEIMANLRKNEHFYFVLAPLIGKKYAFIGNPDKFVTCSNKQFPKITSDELSLKVEISDIEKEKVPIVLYSIVPPKKVTIENTEIPKLKIELSQDQSGWNYDKELKLLKIQLIMPATQVVLNISL